ncbi:unnamed protein product [Linum trigynum]|uniref:Chitin-binding type-1 domain-containing protein n=1 Tax=Linum trigynum TaxID=586398 RepID=A0AAV2FDP6_9ROSI
MVAILASICTVTSIFLCFLVASSDAEEAAGSNCDTNHPCDQGRCCSRFFYCGSDDDHCVTYCSSQCRYAPPPPQGSTAAVVWRRPDHLLINATHKNGDDLINSINSSSPCGATSLANVPLAMPNKYALAAFGAKNSRPQRTSNVDSYCGKCMKLRNCGSGVEVMVRIVDERSTEGLELDRQTFDKLRGKSLAYVESDDDRHLVLEYSFYNCS